MVEVTGTTTRSKTPGLQKSQQQALDGLVGALIALAFRFAVDMLRPCHFGARRNRDHFPNLAFAERLLGELVSG